MDSKVKYYGGSKPVRFLAIVFRFFRLEGYNLGGGRGGFPNLEMIQ